MAANSEKSTKKGGPGRPFQPGQSGNPSGRPKVPEEVKAAFREHTQQALDTLVSIIESESAKDADRIRAAEVILDRGWGKPVQGVDVDASIEALPVSISFEGKLDEWSR